MAAFDDAVALEAVGVLGPRRTSAVCTDTQGVSIVGLAFARTLGFNLLSRLKNVASACRYRPTAGEDEKWPNLAPMLSTKTINWDLVRQ
ncbi:Tn3 family transposase [Streptomyces sp. NPDC002773]|uniref:Tn3 family transposase n=1 Tax=Streptomyces sp. NPDC002773 TaxID=3154430 RepID=UPI00331921FC